MRVRETLLYNNADRFECPNIADRRHNILQKSILSNQILDRDLCELGKLKQIWWLLRVSSGGFDMGRYGEIVGMGCEAVVRDWSDGAQ